MADLRPPPFDDFLEESHKKQPYEDIFFPSNDKSENLPEKKINDIVEKFSEIDLSSDSLEVNVPHSNHFELNKPSSNLSNGQFNNTTDEQPSPIFTNCLDKTIQKSNSSNDEENQTHKNSFYTLPNKPVNHSENNSFIGDTHANISKIIADDKKSDVFDTDYDETEKSPLVVSTSSKDNLLNSDFKNKSILLNNDTIKTDISFKSSNFNGATLEPTRSYYGDIFTDRKTVEKKNDFVKNNSQYASSNDYLESSNSITTAVIAQPIPRQVKQHSNNQSYSFEREFPDYHIQITVGDPKKMGDSVNAYMTYKVSTETNHPSFHRSSFDVYRRFSDFLGLHEKLVEKHLPFGRIIPQAPEKSIIGMAKIKASKEESTSLDFVEYRRAMLERYLNRLALHPVLSSDPSYVDFLEIEGELAKSVNTSSFSGAGVKRLFHSIGESFSKISYKMDETDEWFQTKTTDINTL